MHCVCCAELTLLLLYQFVIEYKHCSLIQKMTTEKYVHQKVDEFDSVTYLSIKLSEGNFNIQTQYFFENNSKAIDLYAANQRAKTLGSCKNYVNLESGRFTKKVRKSTQWEGLSQKKIAQKFSGSIFPSLLLIV